MAEINVLPQADAESLIQHYLNYRNRIHRLSLQEQDAVVPSAEYTVERDEIRAIWQRVFEEGSDGS